MPFQEPLRAEIDGVPVWFTDVPGPCMGGLIFRVGRADETLSTHGITHAVEHLALRPLVAAPFDMNGRVEALLTRFSVAGSQDRVESFMGQLCSSIAALPTDRLELERRILLTESRWRGSSFGDTESERFGARGFGLTDWAEMGLHDVSAGQIDDWRNGYFTRSNVVAWITRPPTAALRIELPSGPRPPVPEPQPVPDLVLPAHTRVDGLVVGCSLLAPRSMPLFVAMQVIRDRVFSTLRIERGLCYSVFGGDDRVGVRDSLFVTGCDAAEGHGADVVDGFVDVLGSVAAGRITTEEVEIACASSMPWGSSDPSRPAAEAVRKAEGELLGHTPATWEDLEAEAASLDASRVAAALEAALGGALLVVPEGEEVPDRFAREQAPRRDRRVNGRLYVRWDGNTVDEVVLGPEGVSRAIGLNDITTVTFDECVLAAFAPTGTIWLVDGRGAGLFLEPNQLMRGRVLASTIRERIPDRVVDIKGARSVGSSCRPRSRSTTRGRSRRCGGSSRPWPRRGRSASGRSSWRSRIIGSAASWRSRTGVCSMSRTHGMGIRSSRSHGPRSARCRSRPGCGASDSRSSSSPGRSPSSTASAPAPALRSSSVS